MKNYFTILLLAPFLSISQEKNDVQSAFDFWVGEWKVTWYKADSTIQHGTNSISKIQDGKVIEENFNDPNNNFTGISISVYSPLDSTWHQAWADNSGSYFNFIGNIEKDRRIFSTVPRLEGESSIVLRMVFYEIEDDKFTWDWEKSIDGGLTWNLKWRIYYTRIE